MNNLRPIWQTPVWEVHTGFDSAFNEQLLNECYQIGQQVRIDQNPKDSLWDYAGPCVTALRQKMIDVVTESVNRDIKEAADLNLRYDCPMAWINVKEPGTSIELHGHPDSTFAVTYYIKTPEECGNLVLVDTNTYLLGGETTLKTIKPEAGKLVFFPAYVLHYIEENRSNDLRISLSTDMTQVIDRSAPNALVIKSWCNSLLKIRDWNSNN
jgi:oxalate decarboxylase/phosphoglucose isomerase-like protein (cupin superfamily)